MPRPGARQRMRVGDQVPRAHRERPHPAELVTAKPAPSVPRASRSRCARPLKASPAWHTYCATPDASRASRRREPWKLHARGYTPAKSWPAPQKLPIGPSITTVTKKKTLPATFRAFGASGSVTLCQARIGSSAATSVALPRRATSRSRAARPWRFRGHEKAAEPHICERTRTPLTTKVRRLGVSSEAHHGGVEPRSSGRPGRHLAPRKALISLRGRGPHSQRRSTGFRRNPRCSIRARCSRGPCNRVSGSWSSVQKRSRSTCGTVGATGGSHTSLAVALLFALSRRADLNLMPACCRCFRSGLASRRRTRRPCALTDCSTAGRGELIPATTGSCWR